MADYEDNDDNLNNDEPTSSSSDGSNRQYPEQEQDIENVDGQEYNNEPELYDESNDDADEKEKFSIKDHIMFHKALISEEEDNTKLDDYIDLVEQLEEGMLIVFPDAFDRAIAITFELAIKNQFDPWDIDLDQFSSEYLKHVKKTNDLDLVTAGRIILMAWKILKLQSDKVLEDAQTVNEIEDNELWHEPEGDWFTNDDDFEFTTAVINNPSPPIKEMIWHKGTRRVSLMELVGALEEAKRESELFKILNERRAEERENIKKYRKQNINNKLHQENLQEDIEMVYNRISKFNGHPIPLSDIYKTETEDIVTTLVSSLFLAHNSKINIWQRKFPFGQIFVKNLHNYDISEGLGIGLLKERDRERTLEKEMPQKDGANGGSATKGKILLKELEFKDTDNTKLDEKKKKKLKKELEELMSSQVNIAS